LDILPPRQFTPADFAAENELITGQRTGASMI